MVPKRVIFGSQSKLGFQRALLGGIHGAMVNADLVGESPGRPTFHSCGNHRDMIDAAAFHGRVSPDRLIAFSTKKLTPSPNIFDIGKAVIVLQRTFFERRSPNSQAWVLGKLGQEVLKMLALEGNVCIKSAGHL